MGGLRALQGREGVWRRRGDGCLRRRQLRLGVGESGFERGVAGAVLQRLARGGDVGLGRADLRFDVRAGVVDRGRQVVDRVEQGDGLGQSGLARRRGIPCGVLIRWRGRERRRAVRGSGIRVVDPLPSFFQVALDRSPARFRVRLQPLQRRLSSRQSGPKCRGLRWQACQDLGRSTLQVAQLLEPLLLGADQGAHPLRTRDDLVEHRLARGRVLGGRVIELLAHHERGLQLCLCLRERRPERLHLLRAELRLGEPDVLASVAHRVVGLDQQLVRLARELPGAPIALFGRQMCDTPAPEPRHDHGGAEHHHDQPDQQREDAVVRARRSGALRLARHGCGNRDGPTQAPAGQRLAEPTGERDDPARIVAGREARHERAAEQRVDVSCAERAQCAVLVIAVLAVVDGYQQHHVVAAQAVLRVRVLGELRRGLVAAGRDEHDVQLDVVLGQQAAERRLDLRRAAPQRPGLVGDLTLQLRRRLRRRRGGCLKQKHCPGEPEEQAQATRGPKHPGRHATPVRSPAAAPTRRPDRACR